VLFLIPRVLCIVFAVFLSLFALDVFSEGYGFGETILALLIHLVPTSLVVIALVVAWRWAGAGAILFIALALVYLVMSRGLDHFRTAVSHRGSFSVQLDI
jgi:hypothetical protein